MLLPRCSGDFRHILLELSRLTNTAPAVKSMLVRNFQSPFGPLGIKRNVPKHDAWRQIQCFEAREHCTCAQIHFETISQPLENSAPVHNSKVRNPEYVNMWTTRKPYLKIRFSNWGDWERLGSRPYFSPWPCKPCKTHALEPNM